MRQPSGVFPLAHPIQDSDRAPCCKLTQDANGLAGGSVPVLLLCSDRYEAPHVHVERDDKVAKFWLRPVGLERSGGASIGDQAIGAVVVTAFR